MQINQTSQSVESFDRIHSYLVKLIKFITIITKGNSNHAPRCLREAWLLFLSDG